MDLIVGEGEEFFNKKCITDISKDKRELIDKVLNLNNKIIKSIEDNDTMALNFSRIELTKAIDSYLKNK